MKKVVYEKLIKFLDKNNYLYKYQFGFRKNYDAKTAIIKLTNLLLDNLERRMKSVGIFMDVTKAFDTVNE